MIGIDNFRQRSSSLLLLSVQDEILTKYIPCALFCYNNARQGNPPSSTPVTKECGNGAGYRAVPQGSVLGPHLWNIG